MFVACQGRDIFLNHSNFIDSSQPKVDEAIKIFDVNVWLPCGSYNIQIDLPTLVSEEKIQLNKVIFK